MRIVQLTNDNREIQRKYWLDEPIFGPAPEALLEGFKALGNEVEVHVVSCLQQMPRHSPTKLADNIFYHPLHVPKIGWLRTGYQGCIRAARRAIHELQPDIVHGQGTERDCSMCAVFSGFKNVLTIHGNMRLVARFLRAKPMTFYWLASRLEKLCLQRTAGVVAISRYTQSSVSPYTRRTWLVPNAVHPSFFTIERRRDNALPRILCAANIGARKNQIGLISALDKLVAEVPFTLVFAGAGSETDSYYRRFVDMVANRPWCEYVGPLQRDHLQSEIAVASIGVLPSFEDNCPMVILEAAASHLPFAASRVGGIPDLIVNGENGLLFDPHDAGSMLSAVRSLLVNRTLAESMATLAQRRSLERFSPSCVANQHLAIYQELLCQK